MGRDVMAVVEVDRFGNGDWELFAGFPSLDRYLRVFEKIEGLRAVAPPAFSCSRETVEFFEDECAVGGYYVVDADDFMEKLAPLPMDFGSIGVVACMAKADRTPDWPEARARVLFAFDQ